MPTTVTTDAATGRDPVIETQSGRVGIGIGIGTVDETDLGHATGHIATEAHQEIVATVAIAAGTTPGAIETVVGEVLGVMGHPNIETTRAGDRPHRVVARALELQNYPREASMAATDLALSHQCQSRSAARTAR